MKNKFLPSLLLTALTFLFIITPNASLKAQNEKGKSVVTVGAGYSLVSFVFDIVSSANGTDNVSVTSIPVLNAMYDYALADRFSVGVAYSYQSLTVNYTDYKYTSPTLKKEVVESFKERITRQNIGIRPLFHFGNNEDLDMYFGFRVSMTYWGLKSTSNFGHSNSAAFNDGRPKFQVLMGGKYFFSEQYGINIEAAVGPSYFLHMGGCFKF